MKLKENIEPFGKEWRNQLMKLPKTYLIDTLLKPALIKLQATTPTQKPVSDEEIKKMALKRANYNPFAGKTGKDVHFQGWISGAKCLRDKLTTQPPKSAGEFFDKKHPKEKAIELVAKFNIDFATTHKQAKQCALIAVDEIFKAMAKEIIFKYPFTKQQKKDWNDATVKLDKHWQQVKTEIEKL